MYNSSSSRDAYGGQQQPKAQSYSLGADGASSLSLDSRHSSAGAHYGGQYSSVYGSSALNTALQVPAASAKGAGPSGLEGRSGYGSSMQGSLKYTSGDYSAVTEKYGQKTEKVFPDKLTDYPSGDRLLYAERPSVYSGRDLQNESTVWLADSIAYGHQHQADIYDRIDAATALQQELLHARSIQAASIDGSSRQADYLATRAPTLRHAGQEILPYAGRMDADLHTLSRISGTQNAPSILGDAPRRDLEDLVYARSSANSGYGISLPPGRAYGTSLDSDYPGGILAHAGYARLDDHKDDLEYAREIERREEDRRREILREREREREWERERDRLRERERDRERERERERERKREREHRREREKILERREKERDRREWTPPRVSRDRVRSLSVKAGRSSRLESPRIEASHRHHSPVKEKRREYDCKVYSCNLVDIERDYLSMDKRYTRLYVSPDCSKVVVNWSRENLNIPFNTPVSFEHDFVEEEKLTDDKSASTNKVADDHLKLESGTTRWNAKMLLMSGLSRNAWEELSSERNYEDRIPHLCNMLRFAFLKDGGSLAAIGGSWDTVDGSDPSVDKSSLVQTVLRYAKELTGLDLKNCRHWNPFLEIHYDRVGKDGHFSHKEVTVLYIPDLSDCLPSIDVWRDQWLSNKKAIAERERLQALKREKLPEKKEDSKDKEPATPQDLKKVEKPEKNKETGPASKVNGKGKAGAKDKAKEAGKDDKTNAVIEKKDAVDTAYVQTPGSGKKKIIRKVVKKKVVAEKDDTRDPKDVEKTVANAEVVAEDTEPPVKKKATKKTPVAKTIKKEDEVKETECSEDKTKNTDAFGGSVKTTVKKKVIKRVAKKKVAINKDEVTLGNQAIEVKSEKNEPISEKQNETENKNKNENKQVKDEKKAKVDNGKSDKNEKSKDVKERKEKDGKVESKVKEVKDKKKAEEPPRHPGLFIQTKGRKNSKLRSSSLSLDSLLDYTDNDIEESTFELSLFSETFYEMLQYQMGSRIFTFLQKVRVKFVERRNQKKRQREEISNKKEKEKTSSAKKSSPKRLKTEAATVESKSVETETLPEASPVDENVVKDENMLIDNVENAKPEDESDKEEDPEEDLEEDPEENENMAGANPETDAENEEEAKVNKIGMEVKSENMDNTVKEEKEEKSKVTVNSENKSETEKKEKSKADTKKKETPVNKELLQAFRFFDRNRVGYVRVEDLRLILHSLGKSMSHRDVKELVQSALLESNTGRDDRILYNIQRKLPSHGYRGTISNLGELAKLPMAGSLALNTIFEQNNEPNDLTQSHPGDPV